MHPVQTAPAWTPAIAVRLVPLGTRTVVRKKNGKVYSYHYLRFNVALFPEVLNAKRIRIAAVAPDFTTPPVVITARVFQRGTRVHGFVIDAMYQKIVTSYARNKHIGVILVEAVEYENHVQNT